MRKVLLIFILTLNFICNFSTQAKTQALNINFEEPNYANNITSNTSISEDLKHLGVDISKYNCSVYDSWYGENNRFELIDFAVVKLNDTQATFYSYIYNPYRYNAEPTNDKISAFWISFEIDNYNYKYAGENNNYFVKQISYDKNHGIFKLSGYTFDYSPKNTITVLNVIGEMDTWEYKIKCYPNLKKEIVFDSIQNEEPPTDSKIIDDTSTIENDFLNLGLSINDYYISQKFDKSKWYVVAMSFSKTEVLGKVQSYIYIYNPKPSTASTFEIRYKINGEYKEDYFFKIKTAPDHGLYKIKAFLIDQTVGNKIEISKIIADDLYSDSNFSIEVNFNIEDDSLTIHSKFDSTIIIEDYTVVEVNVYQDDNFINNWKKFWENKETAMKVYFYNFNFPDHIEADSIEYAKFEYKYLKYHQKKYDLPIYGKDSHILKDQEQVISEYFNDSKSLRVNDTSQILEFPTFYVGGNRIKDKQFGNLKLSLPTSAFDYDVSVLLDSTYTITEDIILQTALPQIKVGVETNYTVIDKIEMLELHYKKNDVIYKCQVVSDTSDYNESNKGDALSADNGWDMFVTWCKKIVNWFMNNYPESILIVIGTPLLIILLISLLPHIISLMVQLLLLPIKIICGLFKKN